MPPECPCRVQSGAGVKVGPSGIVKPRSHFGEATEDYGHAHSSQDHGYGAELSDEPGNLGRESEHTAADDGIHH